MALLEDDDDRHWCPHCGGRLGTPRPLLRHECFDDAAHAIRGPRGTVHATPSEWALLVALREASGRALRDDYLMTRLPHPERERECEIVKVHICRLRPKLADAAYEIKTRPGEGYALVPREER